MKPRLLLWRKPRIAEILQSARIQFDKLRSRPLVARVLASSVSRLSLLRDAIEPSLRTEGVKRGLLFGFGSLLILGVLILLLVRPGDFFPAQTIILCALVLVSVTAMLVMDLFD